MLFLRNLERLQIMEWNVGQTEPAELYDVRIMNITADLRRARRFAETCDRGSEFPVDFRLTIRTTIRSDIGAGKDDRLLLDDEHAVEAIQQEWTVRSDVTPKHFAPFYHQLRIARRRCTINSAEVRRRQYRVTNQMSISASCRGGGWRRACGERTARATRTL